MDKGTILEGKDKRIEIIKRGGALSIKVIKKDKETFYLYLIGKEMELFIESINELQEDELVKFP